MPREIARFRTKRGVWCGLGHALHLAARQSASVAVLGYTDQLVEIEAIAAVID